MQRTGRARVDPRHPQAFAVCQRCGFWINHVDGHWQHEWRGAQLKNIRVFVCSRCLDRPFIFNKPIIYPPDPVPIAYPFPENFTTADNGSPTPPPLPWPVQSVGPAVQPLYVLFNGHIVYHHGQPVLAPGSPLLPAPPVYTTPPLPPLPPEIESEP